MTKRLITVLGIALCVSAAAVGCSADSNPVAPVSATGISEVQPQQGLIGGLVGGLVGTVTKTVNVVVSILTRPAPLANDVTWSFYAGPEGVVSSNRASGLTINVPTGALARTVRITVTARKGNVYDYHFEPEGLQFAKPVVLTQDVSNNSLLGGLTDLLLGGKTSARGAYYSAPELGYDPKTGTATVNEFLPTVSGAGYISFQIRHFSGYTIAMCENESQFGDGGF
jgi:hypothetical protein